MNQVMLSVHCASLLGQAENFRAFLVSHGYTVFLCNQMAGGVNYRTQICENATYCKVFVAFMNEGWCKSKECEFEFNIALSVHLEHKEGAARVPYIIPILLEPFSVYSSYPAVRAFLRNCNGTAGNINQMDDKLWNTILAIIQKQIQPQNAPSPLSTFTSSLSSAMPSLPPSPSSPPTSPLVNPYAQPSASTSGRSNLLPDIKSSPVRNPRSQAHAGDSKGGPTSLTATALQLIEEITDFRIAGTKNLFLNLTLVKSSLERTTEPQEETSLRALMDCLCKIKETCTAAQYSTSREYPVNDKTFDTALKLAALLENPAISSRLPAREFMQDPNAGSFWERHFKGEYSVPWETFERALLTDATYRQYVNHETVKDLRMRIDHYNTGHVVCHRLADFVGPEPFANVLLKYRDNSAMNASTPDRNAESGGDSTVTFPLLLWVDDNPDGNDFIIEYAKMSNVNVVLARSTAEAKHWLVRHSSVLDETDLHKFHIITDNVRQGANTALDLNAGEDLIRFVRGRRSPVPILVYCSDPTYAQYTSKYKNCRFATKGSQCQQFVDELIKAARK